MQLRRHTIALSALTLVLGFHLGSAAQAADRPAARWRAPTAARHLGAARNAAFRQRPAWRPSAARTGHLARRNSSLNAMDPTMLFSPAYWTGVGMSGCWPWMPQVAHVVGKAFHDSTVNIMRGMDPQRAGAKALLEGHAAGLRMRGLPGGAALLRRGADRL